MARPIPIPNGAAGMAAVSHGAWSAARREVLEAHAAGEHLVALLGPAGVGKSRLLGEIEAALREREPGVARLESGEWADAADAPSVLLVDEAERIGDAALEALAHRVAGFAVLAGLPGFAARLEGLPHRAVELGPLRPDDVADYVAARIVATGLDPDRLADGTVAALAEASGGVPRLLHLLIGSGFLLADMAGSRAVRPEHVREAAALRREMVAHGAPDATDLPPEGELSEQEARPGPEAPPETPSDAPAPAEPPPGPPASSRPLLVTAAPVESRPPVPIPLPGLSPAPRARRAGLLAGAAAVLLAAGLAWFLWPVRGAPGGPAPAPHPAPQAALPAAPEPVRPAPPALPAPESAAAPPAPVRTEARAEPIPAGAAEPPSGAMVRVVIAYPRGGAGAAERAAALSGELERAGLSAGAPFPVARPATGPALGYFFHEDREAALRVGRLAGAAIGDAAARLAAPGAALPRPGTIELSLSPAAENGPEPPAEAEAAAPAPAILSGPEDGAALPPDRSGPGIVLSWRPPAGARPGCCFVEVLEAGEGREAFAAYAEASDRQAVRLDRPGRYAWRVLTVSREARRYAASPWRHVTIDEARRCPGRSTFSGPCCSGPRCSRSPPASRRTRPRPRGRHRAPPRAPRPPR